MIKNGFRNRQILGVFLSMFCVSISAQASTLTIKCPNQDYLFAGIENEYYFINGKTVVTWRHQDKDISNRGRFLDPGIPKSLTMKTASMDVEVYSGGAGVSFYCNLKNDQSERVAFVTGSFLLKDLGVTGMIASCTRPSNTRVTCDVR